MISIALAVSCGVATAQTLVWTAGQLGGGWYGDAAGMTKIIKDAYPNINLKVTPGGGTANPLKVAQNTAQLGMGLDIFSKAAYEGKSPYHQSHKNLRMIGMSFSDIYMHMLARKNAPYHDMKKLFTQGKNIRIAVTKAGSSDEQTFRYVMKYYGTDYDKLRAKGWKIHLLNYSESAGQYADGQVDYTFHALGLPSSAIIQMVQARGSELMAWPKDLAETLHKKYGYTVAPIPAGTYKGAQDGPVRTVKMGTAIIVNTKLPEKTAYKITKALCEHEKELASIHASMSVFDCKTAGANPPVPLASGAKRYYKEQGYNTSH
jgi:TRAP transporter TAXI family solute receptor